MSVDVFTLETFKELYPQFDGDAVPDTVLKLYLDLAHQNIVRECWRSYWKVAMGLFVAHFVTLWAMGAADSSADSVAEIVITGENTGAMTGKSAGGVSITRDFSLVNGGLNEWAQWNATKYGSQLATLAKLVGKGGIQIW